MLDFLYFFHRLLSSCAYFFSVFFFFQAEDGIRDLTVTGVQTCALPISLPHRPRPVRAGKTFHERRRITPGIPHDADQDRKSTRLNSSHSQISYAVFCLKKKKTNTRTYAIYCPMYRLSGTVCEDAAATDA